MSDDERTTDEILAATTPEALFGEAIHDRRALKRAYASLVRRFRPDEAPAVFQHVHTLYERAHATEQAAPLLHAVPTPSDHGDDDPIEGDLLRHWLQTSDQSIRADVHGALRLLHHLMLVEDWQADMEVLDAVIERLERADVDCPPAQLSPVLRALALRRAWERARTDERVPDALTEGIAAALRDQDEPAATAWFKAAEAMQRTNWVTLGALIEQEHPGLAALCEDVEAQIVDERVPPATIPPAARTTLDRILYAAHREALHGAIFTIMHILLAGLAFLVGVVVAFKTGLPFLVMCTLLPVLALLFVVWLERFLDRGRLRAQEPALLRAQLDVLTRDHDLLPSEVLALAQQIRPAPQDLAERVPFSAQDPMVAYEADPLRLLRAMTPGLHARLTSHRSSAP